MKIMDNHNKMKILYLAVHFHKNENKWRSETWINNSFNKLNIETLRIDYRKIIKEKNKLELKEIISEKSKECNLLFLQRGENLEPEIFSNVTIPIVFWSTEPINLKTDVDKLMQSNIFKWVYVHTYSCLERVKKEFKHLTKITSVLHNALPDNKIQNQLVTKNKFAIFNRNLSFRRRFWIYQNWKYIKIIKGKYGDAYFKDLAESHISINIHYSSKNLDDFETGIFEAIASGSVVISETLDNRVLNDLKLKNTIIQVSNPQELKNNLMYYKNNINELDKYKEYSKKSILNNTWTCRIGEVKIKFKDILNTIS
jgi:hypothetical protein